MNITSIKSINLNKKRVFLRADLNVPLKNKQVTQDYRIKALIPTIDYIHQQGGKVILATHIGRPETHPQLRHIDENLSTNIIARWLEKKGYAVDYEKDLLAARKKSLQLPSTILLLENLRFFQGEQPFETNPRSPSGQATSFAFAALLANLADVYINDAFGLAHRTDSSVTLLAQQFLPENRGAGLLMEREITHLTNLQKDVKQPFVVVLGGSKMQDKIALLENFLNTPEQDRVQTIIIGGALAHVFLQAQGVDIGTSLVDAKAIPFAKDFLQKAKISNISVLLPQDFLAVTNERFSEPMVYTADNIPVNGSCVDIGPISMRAFSKVIAQAGTIFANGTMGMYENQNYAAGSKAIMKAIADSAAYSVIGGGDAVAAVHTFKLQDSMGFLSTGGGATLAFLGMQNPEKELPALKIL